MRATEEAISLIKNFEGFSDKIYRCPAGKLTIGYGHTFSKKEISTLDLTKTITIDEATKLLITDIAIIEDFISNNIKPFLTQGQFNALVSLVFNWGAANFRSSNGYRNLQNKNYSAARESFFSKNKGVVYIKGKFSEGLYTRRQAEQKLWDQI